MNNKNKNVKNKIANEENSNLFDFENLDFEKNFLKSIIPTYVSIKNPKYLEIDGNFLATLLIVDYAKEFNEIILKEIINSDFNIRCVMTYQKLDKYKVIKEITYHIGNTGSYIKDFGSNNQQYDLLNSAYNDAKYIRKKLQVDNDEIYNLNIYLTIIENSKKKLDYQIQRIKGICISSGLNIRSANYRQKAGYIATLPVITKDKGIKKITSKNILGSSLVSTYPFILSSLNDQKGVFIGSTLKNNSIVLIDKFNRDKYKNSNMSIFGTSGSR